MNFFYSVFILVIFFSPLFFRGEGIVFSQTDRVNYTDSKGNRQGKWKKNYENGKTKYVPYTRLFSNAHSISVDGWGKFEAYANRDSLLYIDLYGLHDVKNMLRGTLRLPGFCRVTIRIKTIRSYAMNIAVDHQPRSR